MKPQENLLVKVPAHLPEMSDGKGQEVATTMRLWASQYHECRVRQHGLVDAWNELVK